MLDKLRKAKALKALQEDERSKRPNLPSKVQNRLANKAMDTKLGKEWRKFANPEGLMVIELETKAPPPSEADNAVMERARKLSVETGETHPDQLEDVKEASPCDKAKIIEQVKLLLDKLV